MTFKLPAWEDRLVFNPLEASKSKRTHPIWMTLEGNKPKFAVHAAAEDVFKDNKINYDIKTLLMRNPQGFVSAQLHAHRDAWETYYLQMMTQSRNHGLIMLLMFTSFFVTLRGILKGHVTEFQFM